MRRRAASTARSFGVRWPSRSATRQRKITCSFSSSVRRTASVGCAVKTGSISSRGSHPASSSKPTPALFRRNKHIVQTIRLRRRARAFVIAAAADAMHALGDIHDLEIGRECACQVFGELRIEARHFARQRIRRRARAAQADRRRANRFDLGEERMPKLLGEQIADHCAEPAHIFAQRPVVRQKIDFAAFVQDGTRIVVRSRPHGANVPRSCASQQVFIFSSGISDIMPAPLLPRGAASPLRAESGSAGFRVSFRNCAQ